jgi:ABC-type glycerol-3-phosphate transport system substrate-binding protein
MSKYAPAGALASDAMPQGFLTDQNVVGIIPEGEPGYFLLPLIAQPDIRDRFRSSFDLKGADGKGGLDASENLSMAASCDNKAAAWVVMKWLAGSVQAQQYFFDAIGRIPSIKDAQAAVPAVSALPDANVYFNQPATSDDPYPWAASQPRWSLQAALEAALAGTLTPQAALDKAQKETDDWLKQQEAAAP